MDDLNKLYAHTYLAQMTHFDPVQLEIEKAEGVFLYDKSGKKYFDMISGVAVNNIGHRHPKIIEAIRNQTERYLHLMVYGEFLQKETIELAKKLADILPPKLSTSFFVNSGSEAIEGAVKMAKLYTGRTNIISFQGSYHGSTHACLNMLSDETYKQAFRPLIPGFEQLPFNDFDALQRIDAQTACVVLEPIQTANGVQMPAEGFLQAVRKRCSETGALLIFDEIQTALGRTGKMFAFEYFKVQPDILCLAKSLGGGLPIGAFISSSVITQSLNNGHPLIGHATTFGGHPLSCATALATLEVIERDNLLGSIDRKHHLLRQHLKHPLIKEIRGAGLLLAVDLGDPKTCHTFIQKLIEAGAVSYSFLFNNTSFSMMPPLTIGEEELIRLCALISQVLDDCMD